VQRFQPRAEVVRRRAIEMLREFDKLLAAIATDGDHCQLAASVVQLMVRRRKGGVQCSVLRAVARQQQHT
jgi:hypothetical protein